MMAAVAENTMVHAKEDLSPEDIARESFAARRSDDVDHQPSFSDSNNKNNEMLLSSTTNERTTSQNFTDIEDRFEKKNDNCVDSDYESKTYWDLVATIYVPLVLLWFRRSMFGPANLIRSIIVGQLMRLVFLESVSEWFIEKLPSWLEVLLFQSTGPAGASSSGHVSLVLGTGNGKVDPHAWPPPAFTALALLTIFALVVHPDGLTWIMLGKLRDAIYALFSVFGQYLEFLVNDYGAFPTIIASATLAAMLFVVFLVIRTLSPKKSNSNSNNHNNSHNNERKKKKKKGGNTRHRREHHHHQNHHRSNRIKYASQLQSQSQHEVEEKDSTTEARPFSPLPSSPPSEMHDDQSPPSPRPSSPDSSPDSTRVTSSPMSIPPLPSTLSKEIIREIRTNENCFMPIGPSKSKDSLSRRRMMSASTMDTLPMSDDQSCGSTSVRSYPSVSVNSNRSGNKMNKNVSSTPSRRGKRNGMMKSPKNVERSSGKKNKGPPSESSVSSRWDALKPEHNQNNNNGTMNGANSHNAYSHHHNHHGNGNTGSKKQQRYPRGNGRRGPGGNGNGSGRKARQHPSSGNNKNEQPIVDRANQTPIIPSPTSASSSTGKNVRPNRKEKSFFSSTNANTSSPSVNSYNASPQSNIVPGPPPGFQKVHVVSEMEKNQSGLYQRRQQQFQNDLSVPTLFERPHTAMTQTPTERQHSYGSSQYTGTVISPHFFPSENSSPSYGGSGVQENPFSNNHTTSSYTHCNSSLSHYQANVDSQIEADLQELGGQMAGSILDF